MKFLGCSRCFSNVDEPTLGSLRKDRNATDNCDPLLMTKRPSSKSTNRDKSSRTNSTASGSKLPVVLRALGAPWQRRRRCNRPKARLETRRKVKKRDLLRDKENADSYGDKISGGCKIDASAKGRKRMGSSEKFFSNQSGIVRVFSKEPRRIDIQIGARDKSESFRATDPQDFERDYNKHLEALKVLLENEGPFESFEERHNFRNKLSTLDFRRINTIALPDNSWNDTVWDVLDFRDSLEYFSDGVTTEQMLDMLASEESTGGGKLFKESVDRVIQENEKIEQVMLSLMGREPILKKTKSCLSREGSPASRKEAKTVRFKVEDVNDGDSQREIDRKEKTQDLGKEHENIEKKHLIGIPTERVELEKSRIPTESMDSKTVTIKIETEESKNNETEIEIIDVEPIPTRNDSTPKTARSTMIVTIYQIEESTEDRVGSMDALGSGNVMEIDDDTRTEKGTHATLNGSLNNSTTANERNNADAETKRTSQQIEPTSKHVDGEATERREYSSMPRPSRARKNRRNRNNKRSNNPQQKNECHDKSASTSDDRRDENSDVETTTEKESVATPRDITDSQKLEKLGIDHLENEDNQDSSKDRVEPTDNPGEKRLEAVELAAENPTPIGTNVNGRAIKVTTEESLPDGEQNSSLKRATINKLQARHGRKRLKVERRAINAETKIVEIKTLSGSSPLAASVGHVAGVGILETGGIAESDEANGTIVTISEPPEPIQPLPSTVASKVEGLMLGKREFDELTLLATASADNNNNDDEPSDGPEIHEVTDSDAETDNSINSRPTTAAVFIVEAESDVERDSVLDQRCHDTIAEESEDHEDETLLESEGFPDLDDVEISQEILDLGELRKDTEKLANQVNNANESTGHVNLDQNTFLRTDDSEKVIDTQHEVVEESVEQNGDITVRQGETKEKVPEPGDPGMLKKIPQEFQRGGSQTEEIKLTESIEAEIVESRSETLKNSVPEESCERQSGEKSPTISCPEILTSIAQDDGEVGNGKPEESVKSDENGVGEIGGRSSSVEDDSLEEKLDNRVPAKMGETSKDEYCDNLDNSSLVIEQKLSKVEEEVEATKSINEMNSFEEILHSGGTTETSKNFNESKVRAIPVEVEKPGDLSDSQMTKEVENKLRLYIEGLELPTFNDELQTIDHRGYEIERETNENSSQRRAKKRAILDSYYAEAKHADRFLDIIQEEGEKLSEGDERHIRDFINEEIGKFRREKRDARKPFESYELHEKTDQDPSIFPSSCRKNVNDCPPCIIEEKNDANIVTVRKTVENTHEIEKSTEESRIVVTKTLTKQENSKISETTINQRTIERLNDETRSDIRTRNNGISSGLSNGDEHSTSSRDAGPPIPPRRSSNFVPDSEPLEPPTPPSVDYPTELPEVPTLPAEVLIALQQPPVPPKRKRKIRGSIDVSPKRPPLPNSASQLSDRVTEENIYENIRQARRLAETEVNRDAPPLPPLPRDLQELEKRDAVLEGASENAIFLSNFERSMARYKAEKNEANLAELTTQMASSPENMQREHQRDHQLRNFRGVDAEATNSGYVAGNDARFEIASSVGNRSVYEENAAPMPPGAPLSSRKIAPPNFHHSDLARRRPELSDEHSRTSERCACEVDIIEKNKQIGGSVSDDEVGPGNLLGKGTKFEGFRDTTLRRHRREDSALVVDDKSSESSKAEASHRVTVVPVEKLWERSNLSDEVHSEDSEKSEYQKQDFFDTVTSVREERREEKRENSLDRSKSTNLASSFTKVTEYSINDSSVTFSEGKADSRVCVENNQAEKPTRPPRRLQHFSFSSSASPAPSQSFGSRRTETCSSQGQTNSVTTTEDKNCVDAEPRILPTLLVTNTLEKNFNSISPERNGLADDQESSSSGAATPNTVRLNSSNSFTDLASLELRGEPEKSDEPNASSETKLTRIYGEDEQRKFIDSPSSQDLYYVPLQNQNSHATRVKFKTGEDAQPGLLKDLCLRKILSLPYGLQIINEITLRKFNIFKNLQAIQESISEVAHPDHLRSDLVETQPGSDSPEEMKKQRPKTWMGIPTLGDSKLLVCLSPSQQTDQVRTSVDNLLDLHRKFLNRRSYHEDRRNEIDVPKYWIELDPETKGSSATTKSAQSREQRSPTSKSSPGNRLLEIIKENPLPSNEGGCEAAPKFSSIPEESSNEKNKTSEFHDVREDRLRATRLSDWLSLARKDPEDYTANRDQSKILSEGINENVESESGRCSKTSTRATRGSSIPGSSETGNSSDAVNTRDNVINNEYGKPENKRHQCRLPLASDATKARSSIEHSYEKIYNQVVSEIEQNSQQIGKRFGESGAPRENRVNSALIVKSTSAGSNEPHSSPTPTHPFDKCPISLKSAIIDKSSVTSNEASCKRTPLINWTRSNIDPRHNVNPALIDVKSDNREEHETSKSTRPIVVDRSCIDTTSIFNKTPPSSRLAPRKYPDPETLKHDTAADIIKNLKDLESNTRLYQNAQIDGRRRYSLPHECFDRQLRYIEQLENQLKEVILAEEEERKAFAEFQSHANRQKGQSMINLSETQQHFRDPFIEEKMNPQPGNSHGNGMKVASSDDSPGTRRESWHEESRTRQGDRSEFSKKEGHRETTKSVMDQGDLRVENSSTSYESLEEKQITSGGETLTLRESVARATGSEKKVPEPSFSEEKKAQGNDDNLEPKKSCHAKASRASSALAPNGEVFRRKMFDEYVHKVHEREERKQHKLVKISSHADNRESAVGFRKSPNVDRDMSQIEKEFIDRARNRLSRFGIKLDESSESELPNDEDNNQLKKTIVESSTASSSQKSVDKDDHGECETSAKCVIDGCEVRDPKCLPKHLQEFLELATSNDPVEDAQGKTNATDLLHEIDTALKIGKGFLLGEGVWSPGSEAPPPPKQPSPERGKNNEKDAGIPPIWTPSSAGTSPVAERKEFRPVAFESPVLSRKKYTSQISSTEAPPPWKDEDLKKEATHTVTHNITTRIVNSHSAPSQGLNTLAATPRLPRAQNPTITLLQKAREGQLPKGAAYLEDSEPSVSEINCHSSPQTEPTEYIYTVRREYESEPETTPERRKKMVNLGPRKIEGIGPTTKDGMPVALRSEVKETNQAKWYKKMYDSLHRADKDDDYITVRYKPRRGARYGYGSSSGYLSEPEPRGSSERSATLDNRRRQRNKENDFSTSTMPRKTVTVNNQSEIFRSQPGRIENYEPGRSSIAERETKEWWDEVMDIFDGWLDENGHVRNDQRVDNNGIVIPPLNMSHQASRVLSLSYRPDSKESVSVLSPLTTSRPAKTPESTSSKAVVERLIGLDRSTADESASRVHKLTTDRASSATPLSIATSSAAKLSRTNPVPATLIINRSSAKSLIASTIQQSRYTLANSPIKTERRVHSMTYDGRSSKRDPIKASLSTSNPAKNEDDRIIRPLADPDRHPRHPVMLLEGKSKSFILPDRNSSMSLKSLGPPTGSQTNLTNIGIALKERSTLVTTSLIRNANRQYDEHQNHLRNHHHHHHNHQRQRRLQTSNIITTSTTSTSSSSSSSCTSSTNHNVTLLPSSMPTNANNITAKNPQNAASSRPFDQRNSHTPKPYMSHALKESGYESDSTLIFRRRDDASPLSPLEQRLAYKTIQKGGDVPLHGLRKPAPERPKDDTEIEYFPISPTLTRIRVRRRCTAITRAQQATSMSSSSSSVTFARYKRTAPSTPTNSTILPFERIANARNAIRFGRMSSTTSTTRTTTITRTTSPPPGRPPTRASSPTPPSPPRRRSSRHNATLKTLFVNNRALERSASCPDRGSVCTANRRHEQCFAAESASNIRFLRERLSNKLSEQLKDRESSRKTFGIVRPTSTSPPFAPKSKVTTLSKSSPLELPKRRSEPCLDRKHRDHSVSPARRAVAPSARTLTSCRQVSKSASSISRSTQEQQLHQKKPCDSRTPHEDKPPLGRGSFKSPSSVSYRGPASTTLPTTEKSSRQSGRSKVPPNLTTSHTKSCKTRKELNENLKKSSASSRELVSPTEIKKGLSKQRERDCALRSTVSGFSAGQQTPTSPSGAKQKSDAKSPKHSSTSISKLRPSRTSPREALSSSRKNLTSPALQSSRHTFCDSPSSTATGRTKDKRHTTSDIHMSTSDSSIVPASDSSVKKRLRDKPQTIVKQPPKRPVTIEVHPQPRKHDAVKVWSSGRESRKETSRSRKTAIGSDPEKRKSKKMSTKAPTSKDKQAKKMTKKEPETPGLSIERIKKHQEATRTDTFFQNLFLRNLASPVPSQCSTVRRSSVMERARIFQEGSTDHFKSEPSLRSLSVYLAHKRPVSNSRFKTWERESVSSRSSSPYGVSWPGRSVFKKVSKFDSLLGMDEFGSALSLRGRSPNSVTHDCPKERSLSEPPLKINCPQEVKEAEKASCPLPRTGSPSPTRSAACRRIKSLRQQDRPEIHPLKTRTRSASEAEDSTRSNFGSNLSLAKSTGSLESPRSNRDEYQRYLFETLHTRRKSERYRELHDFYASLERMGELERTTSTSELRPRLKDEEIIDYDRWKEVRSKERAEQELKALYGKLKNVQRDKDFLFSTRDVDKYKWRGDSGLRCKERSVENIRESFRRLENEESELESTRRREMASKKDVYKPLWRGNSVVNVANNITKKATSNDEENERSSVQPILQKRLGGSKKFWSSLSIEQVTTLKNQLNEIYGTDINGKPKPQQSATKVDTEKIVIRQENSGVAPRQEKVLKTQATRDHYEIIVPPEEEFGECMEEVKNLHVRCHSMLGPISFVKSQDRSSGEGLLSEISPNLKRRGSIGNGRKLEAPMTEKVPVPPPLSETEKKRLSLTLGKEILDKVTRRTSSITPRETRGAIAVAPINSKSAASSTSAADTSPRTCYSLETSFDEETPQTREKSDFLLVLTPNDNSSTSKRRVENVLEEWSRKPPLLAMAVGPEGQAKIGMTSGSEFDSATESSETSVRTVVRRGSEAEVVPRKVEFFEKIERTVKPKDDKTVDHQVEKSSRALSDARPDKPKKKMVTKLASAQSFADLKELFGEIESARYANLPFRDIGRTRSTSPDSDHPANGSGSGRGGRSVSVSPDVPHERRGSEWHSMSSGFQSRERARSVSPCPISDSTCSLESCRNRSVSPDPERYWRAYLNLVKNGSVKKLRSKFESLEELTCDRTKLIPTPKRFQSDPELTRNLLKRVTDEGKTRPKAQEITDVAWLRRKYEPTTRGRSRKRVARSPPIPRIPLRLEDLSMPRINVISKTAELKDNFPRSGSTDSLARKAETVELEAKRSVGRIREKFERYDAKGSTSLLGEMFTSAPNVHELRDIAPYLAGRWVAHKYPNRRDNARSLSLPPDLENTGLEDSKTVEIVKPRTGRTNVKNGDRKRSRENRGLTPSPSPARPRTPTSILKQPQTDPFANQNFDPSKHRPRFRYQPPPPPPPPPPVPIFRRETRTWWPPIPTYTAKPTVTFEEYAIAPPPPPKAQHNRSERPESPRRYVEGEVTIHYRSPVRHEAKEILSEEELARRSAENMRRVYQEERRRKYLQELHDIDSRRHTDNFVPSQKSPIPLNRYDDFVDDLSYRSRSQEPTPEPRLVARALYNFVGQSSRELTFRRGDLIFVRRQVDKNWYEGEHNAMIGLFPFNYVEILPYDGTRTTPKKPYEGQARAKFNFVAQTNLELSLAKGELVVITRRVDENWYEGRIGNRKGIFPVSYVEVMAEPGHRSETPVLQSSKPVASPAAHSLLSNGTSGGKMSMGPHHYTPTMPVNTSTTQPHYNSLPRMGGNKLHVAPVNETLHIDTHSETIPYRALYNYRPQNEDELELKEGDTVYVMEKCDDGWYVGSSQRTGYFGTFPGNYVERLIHRLFELELLG